MFVSDIQLTFFALCVIALFSGAMALLFRRHRVFFHLVALALTASICAAITGVSSWVWLAGRDEPPFTYLLVDFDGDGINMRDEAGWYDLDGDGMAEQVAVPRAPDGVLLLRRPRQPTLLDRSPKPESVPLASRLPRGEPAGALVKIYDELLRAFESPVLEPLTGLDANGDGIVSAADPEFNHLVVQRWTDKERPPSISTLSELGLSRINLSTGGITQTTGVPRGRVVRVVPMRDPMHRQAPEITPEVLITSITYFSGRAGNLPPLDGLGQVKPLPWVVAQDRVLLAMLERFVALGPDGYASYAAAAEAIMYRWAGTSDIAPNSRGGNIDARRLHALERFFGKPWRVYAPNPGPYAAAALEDSWAALFTGLSGELIARGPAQTLYMGSPTTIQLIARLAAATPPEDAERWWETMGPVLEAVRADLHESANAQALDEVLRRAKVSWRPKARTPFRGAPSR